MPPRLRTDDRERRYQLMVDGVVVATGTLPELGLSDGVAACEFITSLAEPEVTMSFEEIFTNESKRIRSNGKVCVTNRRAVSK